MFCVFGLALRSIGKLWQTYARFLLIYVDVCLVQNQVMHVLYSEGRIGWSVAVGRTLVFTTFPRYCVISANVELLSARKRSTFIAFVKYGRCPTSLR